MNPFATSFLMVALLSTGARPTAALQSQPAASSVTPAQAAPAQPAAAGPGRPQGPRGPQSQVARVSDLIQMMAALPESAPAVPKKPRRVLVLAKAAGFVHTSIPLAARTIEALGERTGAWTTVISYDPAVVTTENLQPYDAIFLASTTGSYLDDPASESVTASRRKAFMDFVRGGKGLGVIHAGTDSYHGNPPGSTPAPPPAGTRPPMDGGSPLWPEYNRMINGYFKWHWFYPTQIAVKVEDPSHPINAAFTSVNASGVRVARPFSIVDEVYTFNETSWVRGHARVLTSLDYAKMPAEVKALEPPPQRTDHDYALSYLVREGQGRVFVEVLGHDESIFKQTPMLAHILAGMQYAVGDLEADDTPSPAAPPTAQK